MNEEIDHTSENLITYLRDQLNDAMIGYASPPTQLQGGLATRIYRFQLKGAQKEFTEPLVLRFYPEYYDTEGAVWEGAVQNALAAQGYPAAKIRILCTDKSILGGAFFIMDFLPGKPMAMRGWKTSPDYWGEPMPPCIALIQGPLPSRFVSRALTKAGVFSAIALMS